MLLGTCYYCRKDVGPDGVTAADKIYHRSCFKCFKCSVNLVVKFYVHQGQPSCEACYKQDTCPSCTLGGLIVDGDGVKIGGEEGEKIYHTQCVRSVLLMSFDPFMSSHYRCTHCDHVIDGKIITLDNKFVCGKCSDEVNTAISCANIQ